MKPKLKNAMDNIEPYCVGIVIGLFISILVILIESL